MGGNAPILFQGNQGGDSVQRCGGHDALVREITAVSVHVSRSYDENRESWASQKDFNKSLESKLSAVHTGLSALDPEATKSRLTYQGLFVSGFVSIVGLLIANFDKIVLALEKLQNGG